MFFPMSESETSSHAGAIRPAARFAARHWWQLLLISLAMLIPCYWHQRLEAGDLGSHTYNAWLAQLIERGQVSGLAIVRLHQNVLFDLLLSGIAKFLPLLAAEKIAVSVVVLIFFWGAFALAAAASRRAPWMVIPFLAMFAWGWTLEIGFLNYYFSLGISFWGLAIFWRGTTLERLWIFALAPLALLAQGAGALWMLGGAAYIWAGERFPLRHQIWLLLAGAGGIFALRLWLYHRYIADPPSLPLYEFSGADQLVLFGSRYWWPAVIFLALLLTSLIAGWIETHRDANYWKRFALAAQLLALVQAGVWLLPDGIHFPQFTAAYSLITPRLTMLSAILLCCLLAAVPPRAWRAAAFVALAGCYFAMLYRDTGIVNGMEAQAERLIESLPPNQRVLATIEPPEGSHLVVHHIVDRACIDRCFSYGNYEPPSDAFRIRVLRPNPYVMSNVSSTAAMEEGSYRVQPSDLPAYQIYQCGGWTTLCIRPLAAGQENNETGAEPQKPTPAL
ncbi:MAG: hypothetical protein WAL86_07770 [Candidatus Acidiferrales bacterium]